MQTLYDKLWASHLVHTDQQGNSLLYIDRHLVHEVTSPQAFEGLKLANRQLWRKPSILAVPDHNVPTEKHELGAEAIAEETSKTQVQTLERNATEHQLNFIPLKDIRQGIVHVIGPEQGATLPGMTVVCGDSHTSTHGALACLAHGIGTSEVEHVLATNCLWQKKAKSMCIDIEGELQAGVYAKDIILAIIGKIGTAGGTGYAIEFAGSCIRNLSIEARMTICNMTIEAGAKAGFVAVDEKTIEYVKNRPMAPQGNELERACEYWRGLHSDAGAVFDKLVSIDASTLAPQVTWGTSPEMVVAIDGSIPTPDSSKNPQAVEKALNYMGIEAGRPVQELAMDYVFIGSCTNSRIEDLRVAASLIKGKKIASNIERAMVVPGSGLVAEQAKNEGLDRVFQEAGFEWRQAGCSMCLGMNQDQLPAGKHCASTSNRNFEGRQGAGGRTHLVSPATAAVSAIAGRLSDVREFI